MDKKKDRDAFGALRWVRKGRETYLVDKGGATVSKTYDLDEEIKPFGDACFAWRGGDCYLIGPDGKEIKDAGPYSQAWPDRDLPIATIENTWGIEYVIDRRGKRIGDKPADANIEGFKEGPGKMLWFESDKGYIGVAPDGALAGPFHELRPEPYQDVRWCRGRDHWTLVGPDGKARGPRRISGCSDFFDGLALVRIGRKYVFLKPDGERAWDREYDAAQDFTSGRAWVKDEEGWILVDTKGARVGTHAYDDTLDNDESPYMAARVGQAWYIVRLKDGVRTPGESFDEIERDRDHGRGTRFIVRRGTVWEELDASTGKLKPHDRTLAQRVALARAMGGGEWDN